MNFHSLKTVLLLLLLCTCGTLKVHRGTVLHAKKESVQTGIAYTLL